MSWQLTTFILLIAFNAFSAYLLIQLWIEVKALQKSTHKVQYVNLGDQRFQAFTEELKEKLSEDPFGNIQ